jgi:cytochrome c biogenesis protein CcmG, thiol:disulfide interchange protein DsbE
VNSWLREASRKHWRGMTLAACAVIAVVAVSVIWSGSGSATPADKSSGGPIVGYAQVSRPAPAFTLPELGGGGMVRLTALAGKPVVINFWSSTCAPCQQESPAIAEVARAVGGQVAFVGVDTYDIKASAVAFVRKYHLGYPIAFDPQGSAASQYRVPALPETFFLAKSGRRVIGVNLGALTVSHLTAILQRLYGVQT